ncbi:MAG: PH domain-containing protein [Chloroflexi bacterium]|nr:PH domain-containing protein [Chloroflexota bacterium]
MFPRGAVLLRGLTRSLSQGAGVGLEMNVDKIESVNVKQTILGRILGYGTVTIIGTGGTSEPFTFISKPLDFRKAFQQAQA